MANMIKNFRQRKADLIKEGREMFELAKKEERDLTDEEKKRDDEIQAQLEGVNDQIAREERHQERERQIISEFHQGREHEPVKPNPEDPEGFKSLGEFLQAVAYFSMPGMPNDPRLFAAASGLNTAVGSEGGFLVRQDWTDQLLARSRAESLVASRSTRIPIGEGFDGLKAPTIDETSRVTGSRWGGVQVYWASQADTATKSKPKFGRFDLELGKLIGIAYATEESLRDATALGAILSMAFTEEMAWMLDDGALFGSGAGLPLGIMKSGVLVSVAKESGQAAKTVVTNNIVKMRARLLARFRAGAVWFINQDIEPQLHTMSLPVGTGGIPVYMPANGLADTPFDRLYGRSVIPIEQAETLGTKGDIILADMRQYVIIEKDSVQAAQSMHVRFLNDEMTFRWTFRVNGAPIWKTPLTPAKGTNTLSPFVSLDTRA